MEEEHQMEEDRQEPSSIITNRPAGTNAKSSTSGLIVVGIVLVVSLLIAGLFLPPISLGQRLTGDGNEEAEVAESDAPANALVADTEETQEMADLPLQMEGATEIAVVTPAEFNGNPDTATMAAALPAGSELESDVYLVTYEEIPAEASASLMLPEGVTAVEEVDLYGWDGTEWKFMPRAAMDGARIHSAKVAAPKAVTLMRTGAPETVAVAAEVLPEEALPEAILPYLTEVNLGTLTLADEGELEGPVAEGPEDTDEQLVRVTNTGAIVDQEGLVSVLQDQAQLADHQSALVEAAAPYAGLNLDYQGVPQAQQAAFTAFVSSLAEALHAEDKVLAVTLGTPVLTDEGEWDSEGQDWQALGEAADIVYLQMPLNPAVYEGDGEAEQLVEWAVSQIHRHKLMLLASANAIDVIGGTYRELPNVMALENFGDLTLAEDEDEIQPGTAVEVGLTGTASPLEWDGDSMMYTYRYEQAEQEHTVWLSNEAAVSYRLRFAAPYNVRGIALRGLGDLADGEGYAAAIESYVNAAEMPEPAGAAIVWTVENADDGVVASSSGEALSYRWEETDEPGEYKINAVFAQGDALAELGTVEVAVVAPEPTPEPEEDEAVAEADEEDERTAAAPDEEEDEDTPTAPPLAASEIDAVTNVESSFRSGPSIAFARLDILSAGTGVALIGRTDGSDWLEVQLASNPAREGWIFAELLDVNAGVDVAALEVTGSAVPVASGGDDSDGGSNPAPVVAPAVGNANFALGGQVSGAPFGQMQYAGMTWVKYQHKWSPGHGADAVAGKITAGHNGGMRVLLSIPGQLFPSSIDFNGYVNFLGQVAALPDPPDAIEVWNEMNITREWPAGQISPESYVQNMLAPAYNAIKSANPNIMVITGALAPTGAFGGGCGGGGCDDAPYVQRMAAAGAASYADCVGIHYNEGIVPPSQVSGDPRGASGHYTRYLQTMIDTYYSGFGGSRPLCFTEIGYLSGQEWGYVPQHFLWKAPYNLTVAEHAQYLASAASISANSGKVRMFIVFNVDFTHWSDDPQAGYAMIRPDGGCPACETLRQVMGG